MSELCLKDQTVLTFKDVEGVPKDILRIDNQELLPICLKRECNINTVTKWLNERSIPENRDGYKDAVVEFGNEWLLNKNYLSLSDQYWIKKRTETWKKVNYFNNMYSMDAGDIFFKPWTVNKKNFAPGPDLTTNGVAKKRWIRNADGTSSLIKATNVESKQSPLGEVLVSVLCEKLGIIDCVKYDLHIEGTTICSICDNFITEDTELVPAHYIYYEEERPSDRPVHEHLIRMCELFDIPDAEEYIKALIFVDALSGNEDRNLSNIGFIRDVNTLKFIGPAPLFDSGNAYWSSANVENAIKSKFFGDFTMSVFNEYKKKINLDSLKKDSGYKSIIYHYPFMSDLKKNNLIEAIGKRNKRLFNDMQLEMKGFR